MLHESTPLDSGSFPPRFFKPKTGRAPHMRKLNTGQTVPQWTTASDVVADLRKREIVPQMASNFSRLFLIDIKTRILLHYMGDHRISCQEKWK